MEAPRRPFTVGGEHHAGTAVAEIAQPAREALGVADDRVEAGAGQERCVG